MNRDKFEEINAQLAKAFTYERELIIPNHLRYGRIPPLGPALMAYMEFNRK